MAHWTNIDPTDSDRQSSRKKTSLGAGLWSMFTTWFWIMFYLLIGSLIVYGFFWILGLTN